MSHSTDTLNGDNMLTTHYLKDYTVPSFFIKTTDLTFKLDPTKTEVTSVLTLAANPEAPTKGTLFLHGESLTLKSLAIDGKPLKADEYVLSDKGLTLTHLPAAFTLTCVTEIAPERNSSLEGLYKSRSMYCTQCEAEGFRKITYYSDRPDVLSEFTTTIIANKAQYPVLLSNGNLIEAVDLDGGLHKASWHDPFKKPAYLFALVAGDLAVVEDSFTTMSAREITLKIFVEAKDLDKCEHAMASLKHSMRWDEEVYGREYDLDIFMIVAVDDFNMGAMENKGLNIFNTSCVLANPKTTTDAGFARVEAVVAHEYFHNWSGNRVTCRDWFQLSLKEGFTVFRDAEFSADRGSRTVKRVEDVSVMRTMQFAEDSGPMAHPVQPASYMEISNFYTLTIYEKGAELVRMYHTLLGPELFRKATDIYFERHDGEAATIEDFVRAMEEASGRDLSQFKYWYSQAGTPVVQAAGDYDAQEQTFKLTFKQYCPDTPEATSAQKKPYLIPVNVALLGAQGPQALTLEGQALNSDEVVLELTESEQTFTFHHVASEPVPTIFRGFSAPVKSAYPYKKSDLLHIATQDKDGFTRFDAFQQLAVVAIFDVMAAMRKEESWQVEPLLLDGIGQLLADENLDPAMVALMCELPSEAYMSGLSTPIEPHLLHRAREALKGAIAAHYVSVWRSTYERCSSDKAYSFNAQDVALRSLKNCALSYLMAAPDASILNTCLTQFKHSDNMTDEIAALSALVKCTDPAATSLKAESLNTFYERWQNEALVVNLWLSVQATNAEPGALARIKTLMEHPGYDSQNPNKIRSVVSMFCNYNAVNFHAEDGSGYQFLADQIIVLNKQNPQIAARLLSPLVKWKKYDTNRQQLMREALERIHSEPELSSDVYEIVVKSL
ncbi:aminopeptidase N [Marinagarivorans algicola]|uniref:aminopeptidase N n=1 Tax=Marinagarivorans algicola TaxID=1513270 RepID=UPI0006B4528C|nr:aminopeptidase N [Marinagarivorans algicola]